MWPGAQGAAIAARRVAPFGWHVQVFTNLAVIAALQNDLRTLPVHAGIRSFRPRDGVERSHAAGFDALLALVADGKAYVKISAPHRSPRSPISPMSRRSRAR